MKGKRKDGWWIEPLIKYSFLVIGIAGFIAAVYIYVHFIRKFW